MLKAEISGIAPFFIVKNVPAALSFYRDRLGFDIKFRGPHVARWDAYLYVPEPDALAAEFSSRNVEFFQPLRDTDDGLRGFEVKDADGYVLFFGRPRDV
jgi:catechol 2,3-dioxygenase-like lactoylglutathione lyase family enzyme